MAKRGGSGPKAPKFKSVSWVPAPLYGCLDVAKEILFPGAGPEKFVEWHGSGPGQERFLADYAAGLRDLAILTPDEYRTKASRKAGPLNTFLKNNGFNLKFEELSDGQFGVCAIVRQSAEWKVKGSEMLSFPLRNKKKVPGVLMTKGAFKGFTSSKHSHPIAQIEGKNGSLWHMTLATEQVAELDLYDKIKEIDADLTGIPVSTLQWPMYDYDFMGPQAIPIGLTTRDEHDSEWSVAQCMQQTRIKANHLGGLAESAGSMVIERTSAPISVAPPILINAPFYLWITRPGMSLPLFTALLSYDVFKNPGTIEFGKKLKG